MKEKIIKVGSKLENENEKKIMNVEISGHMINIAKPETIEIKKEQIEKIINFMKDFEKIIDSDINRVRLDLALTKKGKYKIYEINAKNPLGIMHNITFYKEFLESDLSTIKEKEEYYNEIERLKRIIIDIFKDKIPVFALEEKDEIFISEVDGMIDILESYGGHKKIIKKDYNDINEYLNNEDYVVWWAGTLDEEKIPKKNLFADNIYGGKPYIGNKNILTKENFPDSDLIIDSKVVNISGDFSVMPEQVAKATGGDDNYGGKGVYFGKDEVKNSSNKEFLMQDFVREKDTLDLTIIKTLKKEYEIFAFKRNPASGEKVTNVSSGGSHQPIILQII